MKPTDYPILISPLAEADGGGFVATAPDLPGCLSDGETQEEAAANVRGAILEWIATCERMGRPAPLPKVRKAFA